MPLFDAPMFLAPRAPTARRFCGSDYARGERGYGPRYARRRTPAQVAPAFMAWPAWPACTLARVGDAWVLQEPALAA